MKWTGKVRKMQDMLSNLQKRTPNLAAHTYVAFRPDVTKPKGIEQQFVASEQDLGEILED